MLHRFFPPPANPSPDEHGPFEQPLVFGRRAQHHVDSVIRTIRRNAGRMPPAELARALAMSERRLQFLADRNRISLVFHKPEKINEPEPMGA